MENRIARFLSRRLTTDQRAALDHLACCLDDASRGAVVMFRPGNGPAPTISFEVFVEMRPCPAQGDVAAHAAAELRRLACLLHYTAQRAEGGGRD